jgi:RNA polymerase sigma factor (sigma-70 family)
MDLAQLLDDLRQSRNVRETQEKVYLILREKLLEPLRARIDDRVRGRLDPEDVLHEAVLRALAALPGLQGTTEKEFLAWVYRIARNFIADQAKRRSAGAARFASESRPQAPRLSGIPSPHRGPESRIQRQDWLEALLARLKPREAEVIRLRWLKGQTFEQIASAWQKSPVAIKRFYTHSWQHLVEVSRREAKASGANRPGSSASRGTSPW